ncbi:MAG TPA: ribonuclease D [Steroidobacteraceae bacterium]|jgi:ribonuclease D|nr:ribonuclease D [Steroidobacteraceae bacterium]
MIDTSDALAAFAASAARAPQLALDTEFMREKTYRAELCLLQIADGANAVCIDPLAISDLGSIAPLLGAAGTVKIMHAARQDLEVLFPAVGMVQPVFDTQIAAALAGHPSQVGYAELVRRLLGVELAKAHTRADWSRRPLSAEEQEYALDDVRHLAALRASLLDTLTAKGRVAWLDEELLALANPDTLRVAPEDAWKKVKGLPALDPGRQQLVQALAAWRERRADERNRPRGWILDDLSLREIALRLPRSPEALAALPEMQESVVRKCGEELLALVRDAGIGDQPPPLPRRERPDPEQLALVKRLAEVAAEVAKGLEINSEVLATRRELEKLAAGKRDVSLLRGWRASVVGEKLLAAL